MALRGKEVADAFIDVHGDLSNFRKDLEQAGEGIEKLARSQAKSFTDAFNDRLESGVSRKWNSIVDAIHDAGPIDVNKLIGDFNADGLDDAQEKINSFLLQMSRHQKITGENYKSTKKALNEAIEGMRSYEKAQSSLHANEQMWQRQHLDMMEALKNAREKDADHTAALGEDADRAERARMARRRKMMEEAIEMNRLYERSFEGMVKSVKNSNLENDFKDIADAMAKTDFTKFAKGFDSFPELRRRVADVTAAMTDMNRITDENSDAIRAQVDLYIEGEEAKSRATKDALDAVREAREEQERYNKSLDGMLAASKVRQLETDFRNLSDAMSSGDWTVFTRGTKDIDATSDRLRRLATSMALSGRVTVDQHKDILASVRNMAAGFNTAKDAAEKTRDAARAMGRGITGSISKMDLFTAAIGYAGDKLKGLGGFNVLGDTIRTGREFFLNIDRHAVTIGKMVLQIGTAVAVIGDLIGGIAVLADDMVALAGIGWLAPAFLTGAGIGIGVLVASFKDLKTVLADLGPQFGKLQDTISAKFWAEAEKPIRNLTKNLFPTLQKQLDITGTRMGALIGAFAEAFEGSATPERVTGMFERMNSALEIAKGAMAPLVRAFVTLGEVGSKYFERFGTWIVKLSNQFDAFIDKAAGNGDLDRWIERAIEGFKDAGRALGGIAGIFSSISDAARAAGAEGLDGFANAVERISEVMNSDRFQTAMISTFKSMDAAVKDVIAALGGIGPQVEAFLPTMNRALETVGETVATIIGYFGDILADPKVQQGVTDFVEGIQAGVEKLRPAMDQIGGSLGGVMTILGQVAEQVGSLIATFTLTFGPTIDRIAEAFARISFTAGPVIEQILRDLGPIADNLVKNVLPPLETIITNSVVSIGKFIDKIGTPLLEAIDGATSALGKLGDGFGKAIEKLGDGDAKGALEAAVKGLFDGVGDVMTTAWAAQAKKFETGQDFGTQNQKFWEGFGDQFVKDFHLTMAWVGEEAFPAIGKFFDGLFAGGRGAAEDRTEWFEENVSKPIREGWDNMWRGLSEWWDGVKIGFQKWMGGLLGFGDEDNDGFGVSGGSVSGGAGTGIGGKIEKAWAMDDMSFMDRFKENVSAKWDEFWTGVQEKLTTWGEEIKTGWTTFWDGVGAKVQETWDFVTTWISIKAAEIKTNVDTFVADVKTNWTTFWDGVGAKVQETWDFVKTWISTKAGEIKTNVETFITDVKTGWTTFWDGVGAKVQETWDFIKTWIDTKVTEVRTNIDNFIRDVKTNWDTFWRELPTKVKDGWDKIVREFETGVDRAVEWVRGLPGKAKDAIGAGWDTLINQGRSIMDGFKAGLEEKWEGVKRFVGGIAEWIAANKGPLSYDKVLLRPAGQAIMDGLGVGLRGELGHLKETLDLVTATMVDTVTESFARSKMYLAGADAALGLADGLKANKSTVLDAFGSLLPSESSITVGTGLSGFGTAAAGNTTIINVAEGAIPIVTPTENPEIVAAKVIDGFANSISNL